MSCKDNPYIGCPAGTKTKRSIFFTKRLPLQGVNRSQTFDSLKCYINCQFGVSGVSAQTLSKIFHKKPVFSDQSLRQCWANAFLNMAHGSQRFRLHPNTQNTQTPKHSNTQTPKHSLNTKTLSKHQNTKTLS